jgi:cell wall-associated NlpC family hydrolase
VRPGTLRIPLLVLAAAGVLAAMVAVIAAGSGVLTPSAGCGPAISADGMTPAGVSLNAGQVANARIIYAVGTALGLPERAEIIALATAMQESELQNLPYGSSDSLGLFQQRPSQGWGTPAQIMNPVTSSRFFYLALVKVSGWRSLPVTVAAQSVQRSSFPSAYAQWQPMATEMAASFARATTTSAADCARLRRNVVPTGNGGGNAALPPRYELPSDTPVAVARAIRFALDQLGTAYQWGGTCTDPHSPDMALHCDCSSLVQQAYRAAGITLPRTTFDQVDVGTPVYALTALRAGDLLFTAGADGTPDNPGHVGLYIGDGLIVQAPETGEDVQLSTLSSWTSAIVAMRRIA